MMGITETVDLRILPVAGEGVLREIICADTEEIHHRGEPIADERRCRCFDHDAKLRVLRVFDAVMPQLCFDFIAQDEDEHV